MNWSKISTVKWSSGCTVMYTDLKASFSFRERKILGSAMEDKCMVYKLHYVNLNKITFITIMYGYKCVIEVIQSLPVLYDFYYTVGKGSSWHNYSMRNPVNSPLGLPVYFMKHSVSCYNIIYYFTCTCMYIICTCTCTWDSSMQFTGMLVINGQRPDLNNYSMA